MSRVGNAIRGLGSTSSSSRQLFLQQLNAVTCFLLNRCLKDKIKPNCCQPQAVPVIQLIHHLYSLHPSGLGWFPMGSFGVEGGRTERNLRLPRAHLPHEQSTASSRTPARISGGWDPAQWRLCGTFSSLLQKAIKVEGKQKSIGHANLLRTRVLRSTFVPRTALGQGPH